MTNTRVIAVAIMALLFVAPIEGQRPTAPETGMSALFPDVARITADFPDDASRWGAMSVLYDASMRKLPNGQYAASYNKSTMYSGAMGELQYKYEQDRTSAASKAFVDRIDTLRRDPAFRRQVLEKYRLTAIGGAAPGRTATTAPGRNAAPSPSSNATSAPPVASGSPEELLQGAVPYWIGTIFVMWLVEKALLAKSGQQPVPAAPSSAGSATLPEALRVVSVSGRQYALEMDSALVTEEKTWAETTVYTTTTSGSVQTFGDEVYVTPGRTNVSSSTVRMDRIWLQDAMGHESAWTLSGGVLETRAGHVLSRIGHRRGETVDFLMACNHMTGQVVTFPGSISARHGAGGRGFWIITAISTAGYVWGAWPLIPALSDGESPGLAVLALVIEGLIGSLILAFIINALVAGRVLRKRNAQFAADHMPKLRQFLKDASPAIVARLAPVSRSGA